MSDVTALSEPASQVDVVAANAPWRLAKLIPLGGVWHCSIERCSETGQPNVEAHDVEPLAALRAACTLAVQLENATSAASARELVLEGLLTRYRHPSSKSSRKHGGTLIAPRLIQGP